MIADDVRSLVELFNSSDLTELSIEQHGRKLFLRKGEGSAASALPEVEAEPENVRVKAHMVGVFYWSKDKAARPPVALHQRIEKGQLVGFIESMSIMNEVEAAQPGTVVEIAVTGGQSVEYGQSVVVLKPD